METKTHLSDTPRLETPRAFHQSWYLKLNDPAGQKALWLRLTLLSSGNGFKRAAETWAVLFQRTQNREIKKTALKQSFDLSAFSADEASGIQIGPCQLQEGRAHGTIQSKGSSIQWDFSMITGRKSSFSVVPGILAKMGIARNQLMTVCEELFFSGVVRINGETLEWHEAPGMQGHLRGPKNGHSWVWGHCNTFVNEQGKPSDVMFEGFTTRPQLGPIVAPRLSSFFFYYQNQNYYFNTLRDALHIKSKHGLNDWEFQADRDDLSFRGQVHAEHKDFAGLTYEDTDGSLLYCTNSPLSQMKLHVYRRGKLEATFTSHGTAAFEVVSREKNPYVPLLL